MRKMCNYESSAGISQGYCFNNLNPQEGNISLSNSTNRYVYVKQNFINPSHVEQKTVMSKVLVNPHFNKTVYVNPNFNINASLATTSIPKIHVNPRVQKLNVNVKDCASVQKIHINPIVLRNIPVTTNNFSKSENGTSRVRQNYEAIKVAKPSISCTKAGLVDSPVKHTTMEHKSRKRRSSVRSKFRIIKSSVLENSLDNKNIVKRRASLRSRYKIIKSTCTSENGRQTSSKNHELLFNKFKLDNRNNNKASALPHRNRKYVYINRFLSISDIAKTKLLKQNMRIKKLSLINISGILYKKSPNSLKRTSGSCKKMDMEKEESTSTRSKFKFIKKSPNKKLNENTPLKQYKALRIKKVKKVSPGKLRKCNIPCPYYRKFGKCKAKENGKCYRKHDPDQIALCTKFLQGACVDKKCTLSHNVSPEKMPTCKFYLEGSCSRDDCPYLHVRISPKADICKDFLEGFCKKASQCDKRHQFLCPDYEKNGTCLKQRCPYPHGKMVRKYSVFSKNKFAKKSSDNCKKEIKNYDKSKENDVLISTDRPSSNSENFKSNNFEVNVKSRYYIEQNITVPEDKLQGANISDPNNSNNNEINCDQESGVRSRPKLGKLPSFIALEEV